MNDVKLESEHVEIVTARNLCKYICNQAEEIAKINPQSKSLLVSTKEKSTQDESLEVESATIFNRDYPFFQFSPKQFSLSLGKDGAGGYPNSFSFSFEPDVFTFSYEEALTTKIPPFQKFTFDSSSDKYPDAAAFKVDVQPYLERFNLLLRHFKLQGEITLPN